jgi:hypothetical protein
MLVSGMRGAFLKILVTRRTFSISHMDSGRSLGFLAIMERMIAANSGVTLSLATNGDGIGAEICLLSKSLGLSPVYGSFPVTISNITQPKE